MVPAVADINDVPSYETSPFSVTSRTPSIVSIHSRHSTLAPLSHDMIDRMEARYGPNWRDLLR